MTIAICYSCGAMKFGALTPCETCKKRPSDENEIILSLVTTDRHFPISELENISKWLREGNGPLNVREETKEFYRPGAREAQRMLGLASQNAFQKSGAKGVRDSRSERLLEEGEELLVSWMALMTCAWPSSFLADELGLFWRSSAWARPIPARYSTVQELSIQ